MNLRNKICGGNCKLYNDSYVNPCTYVTELNPFYAPNPRSDNVYDIGFEVNFIIIRAAYWEVGDHFQAALPWA